LNFNEVKRIFEECPEIKALDQRIRADLFSRCTEQSLDNGAVLYAEGDPLNDTLYVLLSGSLSVEKGGSVLGIITEPQVIGEVAFFTTDAVRGATVRAASPNTAALRIDVDKDLQRDPAFASAFREILGKKAWERLVEDSQRGY
jgi:CRP-like cAMP-binding protein